MATFSSLIGEIQSPAAPKRVKRQLRALTRITDLFMAGSGHHSKEQLECFDARALVAVIELKTRVKLARYLAAVPNAPATLVRAFAFDDDLAVAGLVLSQSKALSDSDLIVHASTQSQGHLYAIAQRQTIGEVITEILIERGEPKVVHTVAKNAGARISDRSFRELVVRAGEDATLALQIGMRRDVPRHHFLKLLEIASASVRAKIAAANPQFRDAVRDAVTEVIDDINLQVRNKSPDHVRAKSRIKPLRIWKDLSEANVHLAARSQNFERAVVALSAFAGCPIELAERAILNDNAGMVQIIAKAAGCSWATVKALLLMKAADRKMSEKDIDQARKNFERLETQTAKRVIAFYGTRRNVRTIPAPPVLTTVYSEEFVRNGLGNGQARRLA